MFIVRGIFVSVVLNLCTSLVGFNECITTENDFHSYSTLCQ